jgi:hypothetical protein
MPFEAFGLRFDPFHSLNASPVFLYFRQMILQLMILHHVQIQLALGQKIRQL